MEYNIVIVLEPGGILMNARYRRAWEDPHEALAKGKSPGIVKFMLIFG
jgi:hypothetical protein